MFDRGTQYHSNTEACDHVRRMVNFDVDPAGRDDGGERAVEYGQWRTPVG